MHISIETVKGKRIKLEVDDSSETIDLKIHGPTRQLVLRLGPDPGPVPEPVMTIFVTTLSGKTFNIEVNEYDTIKEVKAKYAEKEGTPVNLQKLIFRRIELDDNLTVAEYNIQNESTLHMVMRLCGC